MTEATEVIQIHAATSDREETHDQASLAALARTVFSLMRLADFDLTVSVLDAPHEDDEEDDEDTDASVTVSGNEVKLKLYPSFVAKEKRDQITVLVHEALHVHLSLLSDVALRAAKVGEIESGFEPTWEGAEEFTVSRLEAALAPIVWSAMGKGCFV